MESHQIFVAEFEISNDDALTHKEGHDKFLAMAKSIVQSIRAELLMFGYKNYSNAFIEFRFPDDKYYEVDAVFSSMEFPDKIAHPKLYEKNPLRIPHSVE